MKTNSDNNCPTCGEPRVEGQDVCWVCFNPYAASPVTRANPDYSPPSTNPFVSVLRALLIGIVGGVAAFLVMCFMAFAFIGAVVTAFFVICTGLN
ncbi:MAG: hypothetical protein WAO83_04835 [Fuerstiella sp.]